MEITLVIFIVLGALVLFISGWLSPDIVALCVLGALLLFKLVTPEDGLSGFSNPATITVAAMFILSAALAKTGALTQVTRILGKTAKYPTLLLLVLMLLSGIASAFINNTATVAVFLPIILTLASKHKLSPSQYLIPLSFASQFGGVCTLVGTSTNIIVSNISYKAGYHRFEMFELGKVGIILFAAGVIYFMIIGRWLLPRRQADTLTHSYRLGEYITELRVTMACPLIGQSLIDSNLAESHQIRVLEIIRDKRKIWLPLQEKIQAGDILLVQGTPSDFITMKKTLSLELEAEFKLKDEILRSDDLRLVEALIPPRSPLIGHTIATSDFRRRYGSVVLAILRRGQVMHETMKRIRLQLGDQLLLQGQKEDIKRLQTEDDVILLEERPDLVQRSKKLWIVLLTVTSVIALAAFGILHIMVSSILGCIVLLVTGCLRPEEAYEAVDWKVLMLLGGILPLGIAMENTGAAKTMVDTLLHYSGSLGTHAILAILFLVTTCLTQIMSNNATAALMAPIAITIAQTLNISPMPLLMVVTFAASTCFVSPVGYQTNTMIFNPGNYRYSDFIKVGLPLNLIFGILIVVLVPLFWKI